MGGTFDLVFEAGQVMTCLSLEILDDGVLEGIEELELILTTDDPAAEIFQNRATIEIIDNDGKGELRLYFTLSSRCCLYCLLVFVSVTHFLLVVVYCLFLFFSLFIVCFVYSVSHFLLVCFFQSHTFF